MEYIFQNWSQLNLVDRAWFVVGGWMLVLFASVFVGRMVKFFRRKSKNESV